MSLASTAHAAMNPVRRLYHWVLGWADTPYGTPALMAISFAESSFFPIPPDVLQIALSVAKPRRSFFYAAVSAVASVAGGVFGWVLGTFLWAQVGDFFLTYIVSQQNFDRVQQLYEENAFLAVFGAAFTPIPYKVFTVAGGVCHISLTTLIVASALGRSGRFFIVATMIYFLGDRAKGLLEKHFEWVTMLLFVLMIVGFVAIKYLH